MKFENTEVWGFEGALRGMRNPKNSHNRADTTYYWDDENLDITVNIGENDMKLAQTLAVAGNEHGKYLRMIHVQVDISAARYVWSEFDTYHFNTKNSQSTMHKLLDNDNPITLDMFEIPKLSLNVLSTVVNELEQLRQQYKAPNVLPEYKNELLVSAKKILPEGFIQMRTVDTNYAELRNMYFQRRNHRLPDWNTDFVNWIKTLPYAEELIMYEREKNNG